MGVRTGQCLCGAVKVKADVSHDVSACHCGQCQRWTGGGPLYSVPLSGEIEIDGKLTESAWQHAVKITDSRIVEPDTMGEPRWPTTLYLIYDDKGIYAGYDLEQPPESIVAVLSPRDTGTNFGDFIFF